MSGTVEIRLAGDVGDVAALAAFLRAAGLVIRQSPQRRRRGSAVATTTIRATPAPSPTSLRSLCACPWGQP